MNSGHVNYLHCSVYCYNCVGFLQSSFFVDSEDVSEEVAVRYDGHHQC
jgi:hypothetical protein